MVRCSLKSHHFQSETEGFYVSKVIFTINGTLKYYENIEKYALRCTIIGFKQKYGRKSSRRADMNLRCSSEFAAEIGQYFVGHRSWDCVNWRHSCSYLYIKYHTLQIYLMEASNRRCSCIIYCWWVFKWLRNQGNLLGKRRVPRGTRTGQRGKLHDKYSLPLIFTFYLNGYTSVVELFPVVIF